MQHLDLTAIDAEHVHDHIGERRLVPLPVWRRPDDHGDAPVVVHGDRRGFALAASRDFDGAAHADAQLHNVAPDAGAPPAPRAAPGSGPPRYSGVMASP